MTSIGVCSGSRHPDMGGHGVGLWGDRGATGSPRHRVLDGLQCRGTPPNPRYSAVTKVWPTEYCFSREGCGRCRVPYRSAVLQGLLWDVARVVRVLSMPVVGNTLSPYSPMQD